MIDKNKNSEYIYNLLDENNFFLDIVRFKCDTNLKYLELLQRYSNDDSDENLNAVSNLYCKFADQIGAVLEIPPHIVKILVDNGGQY